MIYDYYLKLLLESDKEDKIISFEEWKRKNKKKPKDESEEEEKRVIWQQEEIVGKKKRDIIFSKNKDIYDFYPKSNDLQNLPKNSVLIKISFTLKKTYTSKDEGEFYLLEWKKDEKGKEVVKQRIIENPIVRDKFSRLPMVRPSTWKGHLRFAAERVEWSEDKKKEIIRRLFGAEPEEEIALKGRLYFFPTFFENEVERDVITPLNRETRTPVKNKAPITLEVMKPCKKGEFYLLYVPYPRGKNFEEKQVEEDLKFLAEALKLMFYTYGFSAKKTSGFGVIKQLEKKDVEVFHKNKEKNHEVHLKNIFSILYTEMNKDVKDGASK
jgi:CRISPR-associated protein Cmr2